MGYFLNIRRRDFHLRRLVTQFLQILVCVILMNTGAVAEKYALLVGINDYAHAHHLKGSVNDIQEIKRVLIQDLGFAEDKVRVLTEAQATKANILAALDSLNKQTKAGDSLLWYYSGHGFSEKDEDGDEALRDPDDHWDETLVPYDAVPWPRERALDPNPTMISDDEIARALSAMAGKRMAVIFDSCHSGSALRGLEDTDSRTLYPGFVLPGVPKTRSIVHSKETMDIAGSVVFISAAGSLQSASDLGEFDGERHGALTAGLLRTIKSAGPGWQRSLSWEDLFRRAKSDMVNQGFTAQTPSIEAAPGLSKRTITEFFDPSPTTEIADLGSPDSSFDVQMESPKYRFEEGDLLTVAIQSERAGYLYLFDVDAEKKITQLFPNKYAPENRIQARQLRTVPADQDKFQLRAGPPFGKSEVVAVVTTEPWVAPKQLQLSDDFQPITDPQKGALRDQLRALYESAKRGGAGGTWASQRMVVEIAAQQLQPSVERPKPELKPEAKPKLDHDAPKVEIAKADMIPAPEPAPAKAEAPPPVATPPIAPPTAGTSGALDSAAIASPPGLPVSSTDSTLMNLDDSNLTWEDQQNLQVRKPELFKKLQAIAERYSPIFWQDVSGEFDEHFRPWRDWFVRYDFDITQQGPNWPEPPHFQDERKRDRNHFLDSVFSSTPAYDLTRDGETEGMYRVRNKETGETIRMDLRPFVYWTILTTPTHFFIHYLCFHAEDWKGLFGHTGDMEGSTIVVDRKTERVAAVFTLAHDDVEVTRGLDDDPEPNIGILVDPESESRGLDADDDRPVDGVVEMNATRDGDLSPKEHQDVYVETKGHGQHGPKSIKPSRYIIYATFLDKSAFSAPSVQRDQYPIADRFADVPSKHKYELVFIGPGGSKDQPTLWGDYGSVGRFAGGVNPPWDWRDLLFFKTGWWKDPRLVKKFGDGHYRVNPYLESGKETVHESSPGN